MRRRPRRYDPGVIQLAARALAKEIHEFDPEYGTPAEIEETLVGVLEDEPDADGYELAKVLDDDYGWSPDARLVELLDSDALSDAEYEAVEQWIKMYCRAPKLAAGTTVTVTLPDGAFEGVIQPLEKWDLAHGTYTVRIPAKGHVERGQLGAHGVCLPWEVVEGEVLDDVPWTLSDQQERDDQTLEMFPS